MKKYLLPIMLLAFWSCEEEKEEEPTYPIIGSWEYVDYELIINQLSDSLYLSEIHSDVEDDHQMRIFSQFMVTFTEDSMLWSEDKFSYYTSNDTIIQEMGAIPFQLIDDTLKLKTNHPVGFTGEDPMTGDICCYEYDVWMILNKM